MQTRGRPQQGHSFSASLRSWTTSRRWRCSGKGARPCGSRLPGGLSARRGGLGWRSERRAEGGLSALSRPPRRKGCFGPGRSLPRSWAFSARKRATSASSSRTIRCSVGTSSGSGSSAEGVEASMPDETPPGPPGSFFPSAQGKAFEAFDAGQVDPFEDHLELAGGQLQAGGVGGDVGEVVAAGFETLSPQAQAVAAPVKNLEAVGKAVAEDEQVARKRVGVQA